MDTHDLTVLRSAAKNRVMPWRIKELGWRVIGMCLVVMIATSMPSSGACQSLSDEADTESIEYPGEPTDWHGFRQYRFSVDEIPVIVVAPHEPAAGRPWVWHGEFFGHRPQPDIQLLEAGFHCVDVDLPDQLGSPAAVQKWNRVYQHLTERFGFAPKVGLVGLSRGGLYCYHWAIANPDRVACLYGDAPVVDFRSWPGGKGAGPGSAVDWQRVMQHWSFENEAAALNYPWIATEHLDGLARAGVPLLHVFGDADEVVPWEENTGVIARRYQELGGLIELIRKPGVKHHPHGLDDPTPIVQFFLRHAVPTAASALRAERVTDTAQVEWLETNAPHVRVLGGDDELFGEPTDASEPACTSTLATWRLHSPLQAVPTLVRVLMPSDMKPTETNAFGSVESPVEGERIRTIVLLPVEAQETQRWGDPLRMAAAMKLAEEQRAVVVIPSFATLPWYGDHPTRSDVAQETFMTETLREFLRWEVPCARLDRDSVWLVGFSKSGWGAWSLLARHPDQFGKAVAFDAPLMMADSGRFGADQVFGTDGAFEAYRLTHTLLEAREQLGTVRLCDIAGPNFQEDHQSMRDWLGEHQIPVLSLDQPAEPHRWSENWVNAGLKELQDGGDPR